MLFAAPTAAGPWRVPLQPLIKQRRHGTGRSGVPRLRNGGFVAVDDRAAPEVTTADVLAVVMPHWHERAETMRRVEQHLGAVLGWATSGSPEPLGYRIP